MFRSVDMSYLQVLLPQAVAEDFADRMARHDIMQFTDLNEDFQPFQRKYTGDIIKIQEIDRQVKAMEELLESYAIPHDTDVDGQDLLEEKRPSDTSQIIQSIGKDIGDSYNKLKEQSAVESELKRQLEHQEDSIRVLKQIDEFLRSENEAQVLLREQREQHREQLRNIDISPSPSSVPLIEVSDAEARDVGFKYFAGVVTIGQRVSFERQIFLTSRGNSFIQFDEGGDGMDGNNEKIPFVVFFLGDQLKRSLKRLCQFMNIQICYESDDKRSREQLLSEAQSKKNDYYRIHSATSNQLERDMKDIALQIKKWKIALYQEKAIRITLNKFSVNQGNNFLRAEGWCPTESQSKIGEILDNVTNNRGVGRPVIQDCNPRGHYVVPTHFITNEVTAPFQEIVNTYGVPRYKEFNPAVPTIVTFPFLFAVMYGDIFHGSFIFSFALILILGAKFGGWKNSKNENIKGFVDARYVILLMGFFAIYCGTIYNDCMSIMINGWNGSKWGYGVVTNDQDSNINDIVLFQHDQNHYAFGIDPVWHALDNQLSYENSLKMKLSVIIGVTQMTYGLFIKLSNHIQEGDQISIWFEFVPQIIFMMSFFGYMIFLIIYKWCIDWKTSTLPNTPSLITVLIKMILGIGTINDEVQIFPNKTAQKVLQEILVLLMVISIPWMLVFKPLLLRSKHNREVNARIMAGLVDPENPAINQGAQYGQLLDEENIAIDADDEDDDEKYDQNTEKNKKQMKKSADKGGGGGHGSHGEEFDFSEIVIHQLIHTIEYVLGTISNTASYLRLWALSLAHAELSEVFYSQTIGGTMGSDPKFIYIMENVVAQFVFLMATFGVLLVMDVLECFLHALRLHWVEFQNKFFYADGIPFQPFSYKEFLSVD